MKEVQTKETNTTIVAFISITYSFMGHRLKACLVVHTDKTK